jgi:hypothetical protein
MRHKAFRLTLAGLVVVAACKDSPTPPSAGITVIEGDDQTALANTLVAQPIRVQVRDASGALGAGNSVQFTVQSGGGIIEGTSTVTTDANGVATAPTWRLGKSNLPQIMRAMSGGLQAEIHATIQTSYDIVVRFFGTPMTEQQRGYFETAAARLEGIIIGDVVNANSNLDLSSQDACDTPGLPTVNEQVDDIVIYAAITTIDGPGNVLGAASPCVGRAVPVMVAYGYMKFDVADFSNLGNPQEVILHEMLHVLGSGTIWENDRALISGKGGADPRFLGQAAKAACDAMGGTALCATGVPLENTGGAGTRDFHWRDAVFNNELMTGFYNSGVNPLSLMSIASMQDLTFVVNTAAADDYALPFMSTGLQAATKLHDGWERVGTLRGVLRADGSVERIRFK